MSRYSHQKGVKVLACFILHGPSALRCITALLSFDLDAAHELTRVIAAFGVPRRYLLHGLSAKSQ